MSAVAENPRAVPGDNNPPDPLLAEAAERVDNANRWLKERGKWEDWDAETADKANFFVSQIGATFDALDGRRLEEGREFKKKQDAVYKTPLTLLEMAKAKLVPLRRAWLQREDARVQEERRKAEAEVERKRKEAEDAERKAAEALKKKGGDPLRAELAAQQAQEAAAEAEQALGQMPEKAQIRGTFTTTAKGLSDFWSAEITDLSAAFKHYNAKNNPNKSILTAAISEAIQRIANAEAKRVKDETAGPPGIAFKKERR
jgi:hypothetical protein